MSTSIVSHPRRAAPSMSVSSRSPTTSGRPPPPPATGLEQRRNGLPTISGSGAVVVVMTDEQRRTRPQPVGGRVRPVRVRRDQTRPALDQQRRALERPVRGAGIEADHDQVGLLRLALEDRGCRRRSTPRERRPGRSRTRPPPRSASSSAVASAEVTTSPGSASIPIARSLSATWRGVREELLVRKTGRTPRRRSSAMVGGAWGTASSSGTGRRRDRTGCSRSGRRASAREAFEGALVVPVPGRMAIATGARSPSCAAPCVRTRAPARSARSRSPARSARPWRTRAEPERSGRTCRRPSEGLTDRRLVGLDQLGAPEEHGGLVGMPSRRNPMPREKSS